MMVHSALKQALARLRQAKISSPALDAEVLLEHAFGRDRTWLYAHPEYELGRALARKFENFIKRRARREPVAYITGHKEFYGLDFLVNKNVLIPRPETELLVDSVLNDITQSTLHDPHCMVIDVGTGSGAIAVALAVEFRMKNEPNAPERRGTSPRPTVRGKELRIFATDVSSAALAVARANARRHGVDKLITFLHDDLLKPILKNNVILNACLRRQAVKDPAPRENYGILSSPRHGRAPRSDRAGRLIIVANLPYLPTSEWRATAPEIRAWEPRDALDGGRDGLKYYRELFRQLHHFMSSRGRRPWRSLEIASSAYGGLAMTVVCELCPHQTQPFKRLVRKFFPRAKFRVMKDLAGKDRVAAVQV